MGEDGEALSLVVSRWSGYVWEDARCLDSDGVGW